MDELKLRLEYLESITGGTESDVSLLEQVDTISEALNSMLNVHKQQIDRLASELSKKTQCLDQPFTPEAEDKDQENDKELSEITKSEIIGSRSDSISKLTDELELISQLPLPDTAERPDLSELLTKASKLGREFDEISLRSAELTLKLTSMLNKANENIAGELA